MMVGCGGARRHPAASQLSCARSCKPSSITGTQSGSAERKMKRHWRREVVEWVGGDCVGSLVHSRALCWHYRVRSSIYHDEQEPVRERESESERER